MGRRNAKTIFLFFFLLILPVFVTAVLPFAAQTSTGADTIDIRIPLVSYIQQRQEGVTLHTHIFNGTNGRPLNPSETSIGCYLHLYNVTGQHTLEEEMLPDGNDLEWQLDIGKDNFSQLGDYSYILWCNNSNFGGFVSGGFEVTATGGEEEEAPYEKQWFLIFVLIVSIFLIVLGFKLEDFALIAVGGIILGLLGGNIWVNGFGNLTNEVSTGLGLVLTLTGAYFFLRPIAEKVIHDLNSLR